MVIQICYLWVRFTDVPNLKWGTLLVAAVIYNYSLHMRSAGVLAAVVIALILWVWKNPSYWKDIFFLLVSVLCLFCAVGWAKGMVQGNVFAKASVEQLNTNDFGGQWGKIAFLFSIEGLKQLVTVTMGKVLYLGIASAGLVYVAFVWCGKQVWEWWKNVAFYEKAYGQQTGKGQRRKIIVSSDGKVVERNADSYDKNCVREWFGIFLLLVMLGQLAVCVIYTIRTENVDWLIYGRYIEAFVPMAIFVGASCALQKRISWKARVGLLGVYSLSAVSCICKVWGQVNDHIRGEHSVATIFLIGDGNVNPVWFLICRVPQNVHSLQNC